MYTTAFPHPWRNCTSHLVAYMDLASLWSLTWPHSWLPGGYTMLLNLQPSRSMKGAQMPSLMPVLESNHVCLPQAHIRGAGLSRAPSLAVGQLSWEVCPLRRPVSGAQLGWTHGPSGASIEMKVEQSQGRGLPVLFAKQLPQCGPLPRASKDQMQQTLTHAFFFQFKLKRLHLLSSDSFLCRPGK